MTKNKRQNRPNSNPGKGQTNKSTKPTQSFEGELKVLFEDQWLIAFDKPSGLPSQATLDPNRPHLFSVAKEQTKLPYLALHHRLDVGTSGVILLSKSKAINKELSEMFKTHQFEKTYEFMAYACSPPPQDQWVVDNHLKKVSKPKSHMIETQSGGDRAITEFKVLDRKEDFYEIEAQPKTGRMHQIRVHAKLSGLSMVGDRFYAYDSSIKYTRMLLHAKALEFTHPKTSKKMQIHAPVPWNFRDLTEQLKTL